MTCGNTGETFSVFVSVTPVFIPRPALSVQLVSVLYSLSFCGRWHSSLSLPFFAPFPSSLFPALVAFALIFCFLGKGAGWGRFEKRCVWWWVASDLRPFVQSLCRGTPELKSAWPQEWGRTVFETSLLPPVRPTEGRELSVRVTGGSPYPTHAVPASTGEEGRNQLYTGWRQKLKLLNYISCAHISAWLIYWNWTCTRLAPR